MEPVSIDTKTHPSLESARLPREFRYWQNLPTPRAQRLRRVMRWLFGFDPVPPDDLARRFGQAYFDADPVAEAFVEDVYIQHGQAYGRRLVERALCHGVGSVAEAPASMRRLFEEIETPPAWLNRELVERGARVFRRFHTHLYSFAGAITLEGYRENSVAKPLAMTGAYAGESANRRFLETASFWIDVSEPKALAQGGQGIATALRVRLMHVFVRQRLRRHPAWDEEAWGVPISQADAFLTLMGGSVIPGYLLRTMGYRTSREEILALMHFWRYVGHLVGVQPDWYPESIEDALRLLFVAMVKGVSQAGEDAKYLAQGYVNLYAPRPDDAWPLKLRKAVEYRLQLGYVGHFLPAATRKLYELPATTDLWRCHVLAQFPFVFTLETLRRHSRRIDAWVDRRARRKTKHWVSLHLGKRRVEYKAVEEFRR